MADELTLEIVTPERISFAGAVEEVTVPGTEGEFGVLEGHAPFMSTIRDGAVRVYKTEGGQPEEITVEGGFAEVTPKGLTLLAERVVD